MAKKRKLLQSQNIAVNLYANATEIKVRNSRASIIEADEDPDKCILMLKTLLDKNLKVNKGSPMSCRETFDNGILKTEVAMSTSTLQLLHFLLSNHLAKLDIMPLPVDFNREMFLKNTK